METGRLFNRKIQTIHNWMRIKNGVCSAGDPWPKTGRKEEEQIWQSWRDKYVPELVALLKVMRMEAAHKSAKKLSEIKDVMNPLLPEDKRKESFSKKSLDRGQHPRHHQRPQRHAPPGLRR